jgi:tRNA nucleotidyltransferase (CCA-adding enzyme)
MADYIYLLQTRLTPAQQTALQHVIDAARLRAMTVFLVGGAVRDLTSGSPIRDLDIAVQGPAAKLKKDLQKAGGTLIGENETTSTVYFNFPGGVRLEVGATLTATFPKPGKPVYKAANILDDLRRRDFTANAMAISLNDGSYGLLMDPLNGVADIENLELRLVSNYGFIEDPVRMIRATRLSARLGWHLEEKTEQRYQTSKSEGYISTLSPFWKGYELEEIFHEEDPLRVLRRLEHEGWAKVLFPALTASKANENELNKLRDMAGQLQGMGIHPDPSATYFPLVTAKLTPKDVTALKKSFPRQGFVAQIAALEGETKAFATQFTGKTAAAPSAAWKMLYTAVPENVLSLAHSTKSAPVQAKFKSFFTDWSQARTKIPYQLMQEMRITPELPVYNELIEKLFFAIMDAQLETPEATRAFLEPYSPPAPPPPVNFRRRAVKRETKPAKSRSKKAAAQPVVEDEAVEGIAPSGPAKPTTKAPAAAPVKAAPKTPVPPAKPAAKTAPVAAKSVPAKAAPAKAAPAKPSAKPKPAPAKAVKPAVKKAAKPAPKPVAKKTAAKKSPAKTSAKKAPAKKAPAKKPAKPVKKKAAAPAKKSAPAKKPAKKVAAKPKKRR